MRFYVLGGTVTKTVDGVDRPVVVGRDEVDRWLLVALLLDGRIGGRSARAATGLGRDAWRQRMSRLRRTSGLVITSVYGDDGYVLDRAGLWVDALELLELVEQARSVGPEQRSELMRQARALWSGGPPVFTDGGPSPDRYYAIERAYDECLRTGRRILVVDDQMADILAARLNVDHVCEVARSYDEYRGFEPRLGTFDLVVLDRHLQTSYQDSTGDRIAENINQRTDGVPVMMMTFKLPEHTELAAWQFELGLAGAIVKNQDGADASVDKIAEAIDQLLAAGPAEAACSAIEAAMVSYTRRADKIISKRNHGAARDVQLKRMTDAAAVVTTKARANDLVGARLARDSFRRGFLQ